MDKNKIKSFAIWARRKLISSVSEKANRIGITENKIEEVLVVQGGFKLESNDEIFRISKEHRDKLVNEVREKGFEQVMEEVAYTWFNRFMGLRYMEVNDYLPSGIRVLSSVVDGKTEPDVLTRVSEVMDELKLKSEYIYELLDTGKTEDREEAYKHILVRQCNELGKIIPQMFEKISDYTELLLPDNLLEDSSVIRRMVEDIVEEDWKEEVEIIGWMYQYYISEKKDEVFAALKNNVKITKENIPAATQLFTPKWIVKYMVENSLGRLWLEGHPNEELQKEWKYYLEEADQEPQVEEELKKIREEHSKLKPEDIKVLDPCMGSGHILVYAFDVLYEIYKNVGYSEREIPRLILQNNIYGLDIDDRAAQLASFALIIKARHYNRRLFREIEREGLELSLCSIQESNGICKAVIDYFVGGNEALRKDVECLVETFNDAKEYGSILEVKEVNFKALKQRLKEIEKDNLIFGDYRKLILDKLPGIIKQAEIMSRKYEACVTNPPYMNNKGMDSKLSGFLKKRFDTSRNDLYSAFLERNINFLKGNGINSIITQHSWMFLKTYEGLRGYILKNFTIESLLHLGSRAFEEIGGEVVQTATFTVRKRDLINYSSQYFRLTEYKGEQLKRDAFLQKNNKYIFKKELFKAIQGKPISYWATNSVIELFSENMLGNNYDIKLGTTTGDNEYFLKLWHEIEITKFYEFGGMKWFPVAKGGEFRKWYGILDYVVNYEDSGKEIIAFRGSTVRSRSFVFKKGITWTAMSSSNFGVRYLPKNMVLINGGSAVFIDNFKNVLGYMGSKVFSYLVSFVSQTLQFEVGHIKSVPFRESNSIIIDNLVDSNINICKEEWDSFETSWNFKIHPLLKLLDKDEQHRISAVFNIWETECEENFEQLKYNEEELNRIFIDIYGLQDELTPEVVDKDITIRKADRERDIKSFISYAVGCMLGRYSTDAEGLTYAGGDFKDKWNLEDNKVRKIKKNEEGNVVSDTWINTTFLPDGDNVIPITEDEYFEDDIVSRFIEFVKTVYSVETLEENLDFIADSIGRKSSETARQAIRRYFIKDYYKDHLKVYKKRPIYWMFESGKNDGFKALVYMHRYNDQTVAKVRTDYLHTLQRKYEAEMQRQQLIVDSEEYAVKDRTFAKKKIDRISKQIEECREYDQVVAHLANEKISIDLDDGVKVNYEKFQGVKFINSKDKEVKMDLLAKI